jgi:hypothetical protein
MTPESRRLRVSRALTPVLAGVVTFATTGCPSYYYEAQAYFANTTREPVSVRVLELEAETACARLSGRSREALAHRELFGEGKTYEVGPGEALPLSLGTDDLSGSASSKCAVLLQMVGHPDQIVTWPKGLSAETDSKLAPVPDRDFRRVSIRLEGAGTLQGLAIGDALEVTPLPPASSAADAPKESAPSFGWSGLASSRTGVRLWTREVLPDGCLSLELGVTQNDAARLYLCLPDWAFPFEVDQVLDVVSEEVPISSPSYYGRGSRARHLKLGSASPHRQLELWLNASANLPSYVQQASAASGAGYRTPCGGYADPLTVTYGLEGAILTVGAVTERKDAGYRRRVLLGRADDMLVAPDACGDEYGALGARFDLLTLEEWEDTP